MLAQPAPFIVLSNLAYVSPTLTTFTMSIAKDAPLGLSYLELSTATAIIPPTMLTAVNGENPFQFLVIIARPTPPPPPPPVCPTPTITSVTPNIWFAGKSYNIDIKGTGFTPSTNTSCPRTEVVIDDVNGNTILISSSKVISDKHIVATAVSPPASDPTETACVMVRQFFIDGQANATNAAANAKPAPGKAGSPCSDPYFGLDGITAQILGAPTIQCSGPNMQCNGQTISVIGDGSETAPTPQNAVVGQQIYLTTKVDSAGIPVTSNSWTVEGTKIAGYNPSTGPTNVTRLTDADLKKPDITFYWVYPNSVIPIVIPVTYSYCVNIPGMGNQCSLPADAAFNLSGPGDEQMTTDPYSSVNIDMLIDKLPCLPTSEDTGPYMQYGKLTGYDDIVCQGPLTGDAGIIFTPPAVTSSGKYSFVQIITRDKVTYSNGTNSGAFITTPGLDKIYPYTQWSDGRAPDAPDSVLRPTDKRSSRTFNATMYLLWTSSIPNSIPVPIGSQKWKIAQARTTNPGYPTNQSWTQPVWNALGTDGDPVDYVQTAPSQTPYGYPTWKGLATPVWFITEAIETDQEEEQ